MPTREDLELAQQELHDRGFDPAGDWPDSLITKTYVGVKLVAGKDAGDGVIVCVNSKLTRREMSDQGVTAIPTHLAGLPTDVQAEPRAEMLRLPLSPDGRVMYFHGQGVQPLAGEDHRKCYDPAQGGIEMQPSGKPWVGTFGGLCWYRVRTSAPEGSRVYYGGFTNNHVSGDGMTRGHAQVQPGGGKAFGNLVVAAPIKFDGSPNYLDLALLDLQFGDVWAAIQRQLKGGPVNEGIANFKLRDEVRSDDRTMGYLDDQICVGVSAKYQVGMGSGRVSLFVDGDVVRRKNGQAASAGGSSGSCKIAKATNQIASHLHAGGGNDSMALPFRNLSRFAGLEWGGFTVP